MTASRFVLWRKTWGTLSRSRYTCLCMHGAMVGLLGGAAVVLVVRPELMAQALALGAPLVLAAAVVAATMGRRRRLSVEDGRALAAAIL